jgi:hypothetical protein
MRESRNQKSLESFTKYCKENPEQRFFQALRNWIRITIDPRWNWLCVSDGKDTKDTFNWE